MTLTLIFVYGFINFVKKKKKKKAGYAGVDQTTHIHNKAIQS